MRVELVVIVTMLGIIASFAIPRFTRLNNDVRASEVVALSVNLRSAAAKTDAPAPAQCAVTYHAAPATASEATITDLQTSGC